MRKIVQKVYNKAPDSEAQVVYRHAALDRANRRHALEQAAKKSARKIIEDAEHYAHTQYEQARFEGYRDGIRLFVDTLIDETTHLSQTYALQLEQERGAIAHNVRKLFEDSKTATALIEEYLDTQDADSDRSVTVYIPKWCKLSQLSIDHLQTNNGRRITLTTSPNDHFVISNGQFSVSFAPFSASTDICSRAVQRHQQRVPDTTANIVEALLSYVQQIRISNSP
ncbi:hypothetical protein [Xanthomonas albilineans]|uniref:hypothetical protein n=1 Tax=Xanthomonas albilineans TaxID=29447 RepID=UPI000AEC91DF|nr:hypothetical protein [Xanthomonas albilineans]